MSREAKKRPVLEAYHIDILFDFDYLTHTI